MRNRNVWILIITYLWDQQASGVYCLTDSRHRWFVLKLLAATYSSGHVAERGKGHAGGVVLVLCVWWPSSFQSEYMNFIWEQECMFEPCYLVFYLTLSFLNVLFEWPRALVDIALSDCRYGCSFGVSIVWSVFVRSNFGFLVKKSQFVLVLVGSATAFHVLNHHVVWLSSAILLSPCGPAFISHCAVVQMSSTKYLLCLVLGGIALLLGQVSTFSVS